MANSYLFNGFCYPSLMEAADAEISLPINYGATGDYILLSYVSSVVPTWPQAASVTYQVNYSNLTTAGTGVAPIISKQISKLYPSCLIVGATENSLGLTMADASSLFFAVIAVWAVAWALKTVRRTL